jgi:hypothetical protein
VLIVDPEQRSVSWLALQAGGYHELQQSGPVDTGCESLRATIDWPDA